MDRSKKRWCIIGVMNIKKSRAYRKRGDGLRFWIPDLRHIRILRAGLSAGGTVYIGKKNVMMIMDMELMWQGS